MWTGKLPSEPQYPSLDFRRVTPQIVNLMPTLVGASLGNCLKEEAEDLIRNLKVTYDHPYTAAGHNTNAFEILLRVGLYLVALGHDVSNRTIQSDLELPYPEICQRLCLGMTELGPSLMQCCDRVGIAINSPFLKQLGMSPLSPEDRAVVDGGFRAFYNANIWYYPHRLLETIWH